MDKMDKILLPMSCKNYHINFNLNLKSTLALTSLANPNPTPVSPNFYGTLDIYRIPSSDEEKERGAPFPLVKRYSFSQLGQTFPPMLGITVKNFIAKLPLIVSIFESIIFNNKNPWVKFLPTPEHPTGHFMNLKTNQVSQICPEHIYPWVEYLETGDGGRHYYVSSLTSESSWTLPEVSEGDGEPYINTALKETMACLNYMIKNPEQTQTFIDKERRDKIMNTKITKVFVIDGHSICSIEKIPIQDPNMCVMTLSKLGDSLVTTDSTNINLSSDINHIVKSSHSCIGSYVELAKKYRDTSLLAYPHKDKNESIRVKFNSVSNQIFFGGIKRKTFEEGIFMFDASQHLDISNRILTTGDMKNIYPETTDFQKRIIEFESQQPDITSIPLDAYKKHFESDEQQFDSEFSNIQSQRVLFCFSLNYSHDTRGELTSDALMYRGIDVETLQHYYDCIVKWEKENGKFANEYFKDGLDTFMDKFGISHKDEKDKVNKNYLLFLSVQRIKQLNRSFETMKEYNSIWKSPIDIVKYDYQQINSLYQPTSCREILQKIKGFYPTDKKLVIFKGCRVMPDNSFAPFHSVNKDELDLTFGGSRKGRRRRQHLTMKMKIKSTFKKNKKLTRTCVRNNKKLTRTRVVRKNKKYF